MSMMCIYIQTCHHRFSETYESNLLKLRVIDGGNRPILAPKCRSPDAGHGAPKFDAKPMKIPFLGGGHLLKS